MGEAEVGTNQSITCRLKDNTQYCRLSLKWGKFDADDAMSEETKLKLERNWEPYNYLALDEMGMIAKDFFALLSRNWRPAPVARPIRDALYYPSNSITDSIGSQVG